MRYPCFFAYAWKNKAKITLYLQKPSGGNAKVLKGCTKKVIFVKLTDNFIYEEAYFVVRPGITSVCAEGDLLSEAKRIISGGCTEMNSKKSDIKVQKRLHGIVCFAGGAVFSGAMIIALKMIGIL